MWHNNYSAIQLIIAMFILDLKTYSWHLKCIDQNDVKSINFYYHLKLGKLNNIYKLALKVAPLCQIMREELY